MPPTNSHRIRIIAIATLLFLPIPCWAGRLHPEAYYQSIWCDDHGGRTEVVVEGGARCDCLTETHAIEFDFANKWAEAIGQALHYGAQTGKRAGIVLIIEAPVRDRKYQNRLHPTIEVHDLPIDVWIMK